MSSPLFAVLFLLLGLVLLWRGLEAYSVYLARKSAGPGLAHPPRAAPEAPAPTHTPPPPAAE